MTKRGPTIRAERPRRNSGLLVPLAYFLGLGVLLVGGAVMWQRLWSDDTGSPMSGSGLAGSEAGWLSSHRTRPSRANAASGVPGVAATGVVDAGAPADAGPAAATPVSSPRAGLPAVSGDAMAATGASTNSVGTPIADRSEAEAIKPLVSAPAGWVLPGSARLVTGAAGEVELRRGPGQIPVDAEVAPLSEVAANPADAAGTPGETPVIRSAPIGGAAQPLRSALHLVGSGPEVRVEVVVSGATGCATSFQLVLVQVASPSGPLAPSPSWVVGLRSAGVLVGCTQRDVVVTGAAPAELVADRPAASIVAPPGALR